MRKFHVRQTRNKAKITRSFKRTDYYNHKILTNNELTPTTFSGHKRKQKQNYRVIFKDPPLISWPGRRFFHIMKNNSTKSS